MRPYNGDTWNPTRKKIHTGYSPQTLKTDLNSVPINKNQYIDYLYGGLKDMG